eukprot:4482285-Pyramimonas_sp.AAC.1
MFALPFDESIAYPAMMPDRDLVLREFVHDGRMSRCMQALLERGEVTAFDPVTARADGAGSGHASDAPKTWGSIDLVENWE